jgi:hypothetical protein
MLRDACLYIPGLSPAGDGSGGMGTVRTAGDSGGIGVRVSPVGVRTEK